MERKDRIVEYMKSREYLPLTAEELAAVLAVPTADHAEFYAVLDELLAAGKIIKTKNKRFRARNTVNGRLRCNHRGHFGFVECDDGKGDVFVGREDMRDAIDGDLVECELFAKKNDDRMREGAVVAVIERGNSIITGIITKQSGEKFFVKPDNDGIFSRISAPLCKECKKGDRVSLKICGYEKSGNIVCEIIANLGRADELESCISAALVRHEIKRDFNEETLREAENMPQSVEDTDGRRDLRDELIFTIDGDDARDFDDAVSIEELPNGNYRLGVHIADVTHYVKPGTALDDEAFERGTSVYLADRVIPMLPIELSNGICSLNPNVDRYALSIVMEVDKTGKVVSHELFKSVINSAYRLTYNIVADMIETDNADLRKRYAAVYQPIMSMKKLADILHQKREKRGSINFDFPEAKVLVDEYGEPCDIIKETRRVSHKIIEEFMLLANETVAEYAFWAEIPFVYRVHEPPEQEKIESFSRFILNFGLSFKGRIDKDEGIHPKMLQAILERIKDKPEEEMIAKYMLRSLMKAEYRAENKGHFGLAAKYYCHFTSPIRRYPDLMVHRILKSYLDGKSLDDENTAEAAKHSSKTEREAELCERDVDDIMKARFMSGFIGEVFEGKVSGVTKFGIFIELENTVEGLLRLENMHDDYYEYNEELRTVRGRRKGMEYRIGDSVEVMLARCDIMAGSIDFLPADATRGEIDGFFKRKRKEERGRTRRNREKKGKSGKKGRRYGKV